MSIQFDNNVITPNSIIANLYARKQACSSNLLDSISSDFENCLKEAALMDFSQDETEKAVMGTYSHFVVPKTPRARGNIELLRTLYAIDDDDRENKLLELLHCTPEELKKGFNPEIIELIGEFDYVINPVVYYGYKLALKGYKFVKKIRK